MANFIRQGAARGGASASSILNKQVQSYLANSTDPKTGTIDDPAVYGKALQMAQGDNTPLGLKLQGDLQNDLDKLNANLNKAYATQGMIDYEFKNAQYNIGKQFSLDPVNLIKNMYGLYDFHATQIENQVKQLQNEGKNPGSLQAYGGTMVGEATEYEKLFDAINQHGFNSPQAQAEMQNFGMAIGTDTDGNITSFALHVLPSDAKKDANFTIKGANDQNASTFVRTTSTYAGIPVYVIPRNDPSDPKGKTYTAKVGNLSFSAPQNSTSQSAMQLTDTRPWYEKLLLGAQTMTTDAIQKAGFALGIGGTWKQPGVIAADKEIASHQGTNTTPSGSVELFGHIKPDDFSDMTSLPSGSLATDLQGNYYYVNTDGSIFAATSPDVMGQHLNMSASEIQKGAQPLSAKDLQAVQAQQSPDQRANMWLQDPTEASPLNQASPTSFSTPSGTPQLATNTPTPNPNAAIPPAPPEGPARPNVERAIQQPQGKELAQATTRNIVFSNNNPPPIQQPGAGEGAA